MDQLEFTWAEVLPVEPVVPSPAIVAPDAVADTAAKNRIQKAVQRSGKPPIQLIVTHNRRAMLSLRPKERGAYLELRAHRMFLSAPDDVVRALAIWVREPRHKEAGAIIDAYIRRTREEYSPTPTPPRSVTLCAKGRVYDLDHIFKGLNARYFAATVHASITWGKMPGKMRRRSIRFGSYATDANLIRIHPLLDQVFVPRYFLEYIVYHEMLHAYLGIQRGPGGRRSMHGREFRRLEQAYPDYDRAVAWMEKSENLNKLLRKIPF